MENIMGKKIYGILPYLVMAVLGLAIAGLLLYIVPYRYGLTRSVSFEPSDRTPENPLVGFAPPAENVDECEKNNLVYIGLTWDKWEPEEGVYDIAGLEETCHILKWKEEGKHAVLRFVCDIPGDEEHMDIPEWLYEKTKDGKFYSIEYGKGYAPNYANPYFMERHEKAIQALAEYCNQDYFVSYVELGSLGHWGEWHVKRDADIPHMPDADICWQYVLDYTDNFLKARMLMRRNYVMAVEGGLGIYNDMVGEREDTDAWLSWMKDGGSYPTEGAPLEFVPIENFWEKGPAGGELTSRYEMEELLGKRFMDTLDMVEKAHMTFIGPKCPTHELRDSDAAATILESMGYSYYISQLDTNFAFGKNELEVKMVWRNIGVAPIYWDWPVTMYVYDGDGRLEYWEGLDLDLSRLMPGEETEVTASIPFTDTFRESYQLGIGVTSPDGRQHLKLSMDGEFREDGIQIIYVNE